MQRLRSSGRAIFRAVRPRSSYGDGSSSFDALSVPSLRRKASNSWSAVQDTYLSTKEVFEKHRVVFTIGTSVASVLTAWAGYSLRHYHHSRVEERLMSIEEAMKHKNNAEHKEIKKIVNSGNVSTEACIATAWTALLLGYGLGWRGGLWFANRKFQREQLKLMGQMKPRGWQFLGRPFMRLRSIRSGLKTAKVPPNTNTSSLSSQQTLETS
ncbi:uncharacterized protein LOC120278818 [Dioscorea cayenensis subsp. rotundata]|uniref:Uncharacterized protein LOC120278818 n=1 Tax=Dioscorea cayennensis subsp. rotundata TaxID=55577 RepID=A0AB40CN29_DIOCR|nr:uncharacterized protein LOC120278818 [Dioscorea cayenensis subsp. rotundata]